MKTLVTAILVSCLSSVGYSSETDPYSGMRLLKQCQLLIDRVENDTLKTSNDYMEASYCSGLMRGLMFGTKMGQIEDDQSQPCIPSIEVEQAARIVVKYLEDSPESLHISGVGLAYFALNEAYPCTERNGEN